MKFVCHTQAEPQGIRPIWPMWQYSCITHTVILHTRN